VIFFKVADTNRT